MGGGGRVRVERWEEMCRMRVEGGERWEEVCRMRVEGGEMGGGM